MDDRNDKSTMARVVEGAPQPQQAMVPAQQPPRGVTAREEFGARQLTTTGETASSAVAAQARAMVEARYVMAMRNPRDLDNVRVNLLKACRRPRFADVARYNKPVGKGVEGPSIRFAEEAARAMGNIATDTACIYDDHERRIVRVTVTDLESNLTYPKDIILEKVVERRSLRQGQVPIRSRTNSSGQTTYLVEATEDDLLSKEAALVSKAMRTGLLRLLPGDILDECMEEVRRTSENEAAADPDAARKRVADAFAALGVKPSDLREYMGHTLDQATPAELTDLRAVYATLKDGEATWADLLAHKRGGAGAEAGANQEERTAGQKATDALKAKLAGVGKPTAAPEQPPQTPTTEELAAAEARKAELLAQAKAEGALFVPPTTPHAEYTQSKRR